MLKFKNIVGIAVAVVAVACIAPAQAATVRAWVSGRIGSDVASCGAPATPCRTLQYTHDNIIAAGGEIDILDPAGYGAIVITKSISIVNDGVGTAGIQSNSGNAITINAPGASVYLRGLNIDGVQSAGTNGIEFKAGSSLTVVNCVARHFSNDGLLIDPTSGSVSVGVYDFFFVENSYGIVSKPPSGTASITGVIDHVRTDKNGFLGISIVGDGTSGAVRFTISNSDASNNGSSGIVAEAIPNNEIVEVNTSTMDSNGNDGLEADSGSLVHVARSVMDFNTHYGLSNGTGSNSGVVSSGDNHTEGNGVGPTLGTISPETLH